MSLNIQSLQSKYQKLINLLNHFSSKGVNIDVIALQEVWQIPFPDLLQIPGYNLFFKTRKKIKGGGVGFYIKDTINAQIIPNLSPFQEKTFETITLEITINNKSTLITSIYRSPSLDADSLRIFNSALDLLMRDIKVKNHDSFIFLDANINLLNLSNNNGTIDYLDTLLNNGLSTGSSSTSSPTGPRSGR